jgi:hypothetical protein
MGLTNRIYLQLLPKYRSYGTLKPQRGEILVVVVENHQYTKPQRGEIIEHCIFEMHPMYAFETYRNKSQSNLVVSQNLKLHSSVELLVIFCFLIADDRFAATIADSRNTFGKYFKLDDQIFLDSISPVLR